MQFNEAKTRIILETQEDLELADDIILATRAADEKKARPLHSDKPLAQLPFELGPAASRGLMNALGRVASTPEGSFNLRSDLSRDLAGHTVARLNEDMGDNKDKTLIGRLASAATKINIPGNIF